MSIRLAILLILLFISAAAYPAEKFFNCSPAKQLMLATFKDGFAYVATAVENHGFVVQFYLNTHDMRWRVLGLDDKNESCIILQGKYWAPIVSQGI